MEKFDITHKALLEKRLFDIDAYLSEYCFSNLYLFRKAHDYEVGTVDDCVFISGISYDKLHFIMPCCNILDMDAEHYTKFLKIAEDFDMIFPVPEAWLERFDASLYKFEALEDDMDYLYTREKLWQYPGRKLHKKRNLVKQFREAYDRDVLPISADNIDDALFVLKKWQDDIGADKNDTDYCPCREGLQNIDTLNLKGYIVYAEGRPVGFSLGEMVSSKVFGLHFAKGDRSIKGIYQYLFSKTSELIGEDVEFMNLEQDLGKSGLRVTKLSYQPDFMAKKYRVVKK